MDTILVAAGKIYVMGMNPYSWDFVSKRKFDQLLADGLIEKESEHSLGIFYKLSKSAK